MLIRHMLLGTEKTQSIGSKAIIPFLALCDCFNRSISAQLTHSLHPLLPVPVPGYSFLAWEGSCRVGNPHGKETTQFKREAEGCLIE